MILESKTFHLPTVNRDVTIKFQHPLLAYNIKELNKLCDQNQKAKEICDDDNFWKEKINMEYDGYINQKPKNWSYKIFYRRLSKSGKLFYIGANKVLVYDHVLKVRLEYDNGYFITANGQLHRYQTESTFEYSILMLYLLPNEIIDKTPVVYHLMNNVKDIVFSENTPDESSAMILDWNSNVYTIGKYLNGIQSVGLSKRISNVRSIGGTNGYNFYYYITNQNELYYFDGEIQSASSNPASPEFIDSNIKDVVSTETSLGDGGLTVLHYTKTDNKLYTFTFTISRTGTFDFDNLDEIEISHIREGEVEIERIIEQTEITNVKLFAIGENRAFIVDINDKLYVHTYTDEGIDVAEINVIKPIRKIICIFKSVAMIDINDDLYVFGEYANNYTMLPLPSIYTLEPIFIDNNVLDVDITYTFIVIKRV